MKYVDRVDAGRRLAADVAAALPDQASGGSKPLVLGIPRGGVIVGAEVAKALTADFEVVLARKIGSPRNPEMAIGAVGEDGDPIVDRDLVVRLGVPEEYLQERTRVERLELQRRLVRYRGDRRAPEIAGRVVIVVDDGIATGATLLATLDTVRRKQPAWLGCAVPVGASDSVDRIARHVDAMVCPMQPRWFRAVGEWYESFVQTSDEEVVATLRELREESI